MKFIQSLIYAIFLLCLTIIAFVYSVVGLVFTKGESWSCFTHVASQWKAVGAVIRATFNKNKRNEKVTIKRKRRVNNQFETVHIRLSYDDIDFGELFVIALYSFYLAFYTWMILGVIVAAITYKAIYVSPIAKEVTQAPKKEVITYQETEVEINEELYCPCIPDYRAELSNSKNTIIIDQDSNTLKVSEKHILTKEMMMNSTVEQPFGFSKNITAKGYSIDYEGFNFKLNEHQGFVFSYDLNSIFFFDGNQLKRIALK